MPSDGNANFRQIVITVDGACVANGTPNASAAYAYSLQMDGHRLTAVSAFRGGNTNNYAEAFALHQALQHILEVCDGRAANLGGKRSQRSPLSIALEIVSDSQYVIGALAWNWSRDAHPRLLNTIAEQLNRFGHYTFHKVKAHPSERDLSNAEWRQTNPLSVEHDAIDKMAQEAALALHSGQPEHSIIVVPKNLIG